MTTINLYEILNLTQDCTISEIKESYRNFAKLYHPDKGGDPELFELVTYAYNILKDDESREQFDMLYKTAKENRSGFLKMRESFNTYIENENETVNEDDKLKAIQNFSRDSDELNKKHNYNPDDAKICIGEEEARNRLTDLLLVREQEDIENIQENEFSEFDEIDDKEFNKKFNVMFEKKGRHMMKNNQLIIPQNPEGWSDDTNSNYLELDNTNNLYEEFDNNDSGYYNNDVSSLAYSSINAIGHLPTMEISKLKNKQPKNIDELIRERELETQQIKNMELKHFNNESKDFQFLHEIGYDEFCATKEKIAQSGPVLAITQDKELQARYEKLLTERSNDRKNKAS